MLPLSTENIPRTLRYFENPIRTLPRSLGKGLEITKHPPDSHHFQYTILRKVVQVCSPFSSCAEIQLILVIHLRQVLGSLITVCTALRDCQIRRT